MIKGLTPGLVGCRCISSMVRGWCYRGMLDRWVGGHSQTMAICVVGLLGSGGQCLWEPVPGADWQCFRVHRHTWPTYNHQLSARPAVQVQLQLPSGVPGEQHTAGLVSTCYVWFCNHLKLQAVIKRMHVEVWYIPTCHKVNYSIKIYEPLRKKHCWR